MSEENQLAMGDEPPASSNKPSASDVTKSELKNKKTEIKMEPHIHPQIHHEKKWKDYLFEFLMLFLAVSGGFFMENVRENRVERHREKEYILSFIADVKKDTAEMQLQMNQITSANKGIDSLLSIAEENVSIPENTKLFYHYFIKYVPYRHIVSLNDGTMQQLKNAGGLRLIQKAHAADSIMRYDVGNRIAENQGEAYGSNTHEVIDASDYIIDWMVFEKVTTKQSFDNIPPFNPDKEKLRFFLNKLVKQKATALFYKRDVEVQFQYASRLIPFLQKEYHLENE